MNSLGYNLKRYRQLRGLTQRELAESLKVTRGAIAKIEAGERMPGFPFVCQAAKLLKCAIDDLAAEIPEKISV